MSGSRTLRKSTRLSSPTPAPTTAFVAGPDAASPIPLTSNLARGHDETAPTNGYNNMSTIERWRRASSHAPLSSIEGSLPARSQTSIVEHLTPLSSSPAAQKLKLRVKQYDPFRQTPGTRTSDGSASVKTAARNMARKPRRHRDRDDRPASNSTKERRLRSRPSQVKLENGRADKASSSSSIPSSPRHLTSSADVDVIPRLGLPSRAKLGQVVDAAVERAAKLGDEVLGLAIRWLFEESHQNVTLYELLCSVLAQKQTEKQALEFQAHVKIARKHVKRERLNTHSSYKSITPAISAPSSQKASPQPPSRPSVRPTKRARRSMPAATEPPAPPSAPVSRQPSTRRTRQSEDAPPTFLKPEDALSSKQLSRSKTASPVSELSDAESVDLPAEGFPNEESGAVAPQSGRAVRSLGAIKPPTVINRQLAGLKRPAEASSPALQAEISAQIEELSHKKRRLQRTFDDIKVEHSDLRGPSLRSSRRDRFGRSTLFPGLSGPDSARLARAHDLDNLDSPASSTAELLVPPPPGALRPSRSRETTPPQAPARMRNTLTRAARIKTSPMKKKTGVTAGIARITRAEILPENGDFAQGDNTDNCVACSGNGELLCCDGCPRSFHFGCLDPPMDPDYPPDGEWMCSVCESRRMPPIRPGRGLFSGLERTLERQNPRAFALPLSIRDYFEGVKTGEEGEYEESSNIKPKIPRLVPGYNELQNEKYRMRDSKNQIILCFACGKSAAGHREIINCDFCSLRWHLDCLTPPLSNPPVRDLQDGTRHNWMCPAHIDQEPLLNSDLGQQHRLRRPKNAKIVDTQLTRGFRNDGVIEIEEDDSDIEQSLQAPESVVYRLSERGIKLDFIDRVRQLHSIGSSSGDNDEVPPQQSFSQITQEETNAESFNGRSILDQQAAVNLAAFADRQNDLGMASDQVQSLIHAVVSEAPAQVVAMIHAESGPHKAEDTLPRPAAPSIPPTPPISDSPERALSADEKRQLLLLQELIRRRLVEGDGPGA